MTDRIFIILLSLAVSMIIAGAIAFSFYSIKAYQHSSCYPVHKQLINENRTTITYFANIQCQPSGDHWNETEYYWK